MCYPLPGPRCYTHASDNLASAKGRLEAAVAAEKNNARKANKERLRKALENFRARQSDLDTTNNGLIKLAQDYTDAKGTPNEDAYARRLHYAKLKRSQQVEWQKEFQHLKREKLSTSPQLTKLENRIEITNAKILEEGSIYDPALRGEKRPNPQSVRPKPVVTVTPTVPEKPVEPVQVLKPAVDDDLPGAKIEPVKITSFADLDTARPHMRKTAKPAHKGEMAKMTKKQKSQQVRMQGQVSTLDSVRATRQDYAGRALTNDEGHVVADKVITTPTGLMWVLDKGGYDSRIPVAKSKNSPYYRQFGFAESSAA